MNWLMNLMNWLMNLMDLMNLMNWLHFIETIRWIIFELNWLGQQRVPPLHGPFTNIRQLSSSSSSSRAKSSEGLGRPVGRRSRHSSQGSSRLGASGASNNTSVDFDYRYSYKVEDTPVTFSRNRLTSHHYIIIMNSTLGWSNQLFFNLIIHLFVKLWINWWIWWINWWILRINWLID